MKSGGCSSPLGSAAGQGAFQEPPEMLPQSLPAVSQQLGTDPAGLVCRCHSGHKAWMENTECQAPRPGLAMRLFLCSLPTPVPVCSGPLRLPEPSSPSPKEPPPTSHLAQFFQPTGCPVEASSLRTLIPWPPNPGSLQTLAPAGASLLPQSPHLGRFPSSSVGSAAFSSPSLGLWGAVPMTLRLARPRRPVLTLFIPPPPMTWVRQRLGQGTGPEWARIEPALPGLARRSGSWRSSTRWKSRTRDPNCLPFPPLEPLASVPSLAAGPSSPPPPT